MRLFYKQIRVFNNEFTFFSGVKNFWAFLNDQPVIDDINKISSIRKAHSVSTVDFSTPYTNIEHVKLEFMFRELTNFCSNGDSKNCIAARKFRSRLVDNRKKCNIVLDKANLKLAISYLLDDVCFTVGNSTLILVNGIPTGSDPAQFMEILFLYYLENNYLTSTQSMIVYVKKSVLKDPSL